MSDNWIIVFPESSSYVPSDTARDRAIALFRQLAPEADEVTSETTPNPRFIDCGGNLRRVICPVCRAEVDLNWWSERLGDEYEANFPIRKMNMSCCHSQLGIDQLEYDWPQGIARFSVEAMNPNIRDLSDQNLADFEQILGCKVRKVLRHI
jgi:hypothetical protein